MREIFAGADWINAHICKEPSPLGCAVADLLGDLFRGIYHLDSKGLRRVAWSDKFIVRLTVRRSLSTFDFDLLTRLVFLCHDRALRCEVEGCGPGWMRLTFHQRARAGSVSERHPNLEDALQGWRETGPKREEPQS